MKILYVAKLATPNFNNDRHVFFGEVWRKAVNEVIYFAKDWVSVPSAHDQACNYHSIEELKGYKRSMAMKNIVDKYSPDCIIEMSSDGAGDVITDYLNVNVPLFYYFYEPIFPRFPLNADNLRGIFYPCRDAMEHLDHSHPYEYIHSSPIYHYLPFGYNPTVFIRDSSIVKKYDIGFQGCLKVKPEEKRAKHHQHLYDLRERFIAHLENYKNLTVGIREHDTSYLYNIFVQECRLFLNVGCDYLSSNSRQYHVPAVGTVLLQYRYEGIVDDGFIDRKNCLLFTTEEQMDQQIQWSLTHPVELEQIRLAGMEFAKNHTYIQRAEEMMGEIQQCLAK